MRAERARGGGRVRGGRVSGVPVGFRGELQRLLRQKEADARLAELRTGLEGRGLRVRYAVRHGSVVEAIERYAEEEGVGLIALATHGRTGLPRLLFGSVAERCLRQARVPVLLWKAPAEGPAAAGSVGR